MRQKRVIIVLAVFVLVGIGAVAFWPGEREPEYNGKRLSEWVQPYTWRYDDVESDNRLIERKRKVADDAMQHMGTNALHWLVRWIAYERPAWKTKIREIVWKIPAEPIHNWCVKHDRLRSDAKDAFAARGTNAAVAVPELVQVVKTSRIADARDAAMWALGYMGKGAFPALLDALGNPKTEFSAAQSICQMAERGVDISAAIPAFLLINRDTAEPVKKLEDPGPTPRYVVGSRNIIAGLMYENPPFLIPALINCLHYPNSDVRVEAARTLGSLGRKAFQAVPALREALDVRVIAIQEAALEALEKIAPARTNGVKDF